MQDVVGTVSVLSAAVTIGSAVIGLGSLVLAVPAWKLARSQERQTKAAQEQTQFTRRVLQAIAGSHPEAGLTEEHPSLMDLLKDTRDNTRGLSLVQAVMAHHMADGHGGAIPATLWHDYE